MSAKSFRFCSGNKKINQNQPRRQAGKKLLLSDKAETNRFPRLRTTHSLSVVHNAKKNEIYILIDINFI